MKPFEKTKDGVIDNLLRAFISRPNPEKACTEFDPDLANAYIERSLTPGIRAGYEVHLSECGACRKGIAVLMRLYDADNPASAFSANANDRKTTWFDGVRQVLGVLSRPQWAIAAAAVIVLAISLPVIMSRNETRRGDSAARAVGEPQPLPESPQNTSQPAVSNPPATSKSPSADPAASTAATAKPIEKSEKGALAISSPTAAPTAGAPDGSAGKVEQSPKPETKRAAQTAGDEARVTSANSEVTQAPAQGGAAAGTQVAKKESAQDRKQQEGKDSAQQTADARLERADEPRDKEKTAKADEPPAPPASASEAARGRAGQKRSPAKLALRDSSSTESVRPLDALKKIGNKKFLFKDNTWTDKDFDPGKDLPVITIIRDSNVYKEEITKRAGLKVYLEGFGGTERAIIVYKGTVYKLIPQ